MADKIWVKYLGAENILRNDLMTRCKYAFIFPRGQWIQISKAGIRKTLPKITKWGKIELGRKYLGKDPKDHKTPILGEMQYADGQVVDEEKMTAVTNEIFEQAVSELLDKTKNNPETWQVSMTDPMTPKPSISSTIKTKLSKKVN
jgi:hypothetical protein